MIGAATILLLYQLAGEVLSQGLALPVPGPVIGMALLFVTLLVRGRVPDALQATSRGILSQLSLLFVPAGVGVMVHAGRIGQEWLAIVAALLGSTVLTLAVTAWVVQWLGRRGA